MVETIVPHKKLIYQIGFIFDELPDEIKNYIYENASDDNLIPLTAESIEKIADKLGV